MMQAHDKVVIERFAKGDGAARKYAIEAYRRSLTEDGIQPKCPHQRFMSEIDNPCPDLGLRASFRRALLSHIAMNGDDDAGQ
jgi:hypothetical protein